jgi:hypothetical protein
MPTTAQMEKLEPLLLLFIKRHTSWSSTSAFSPAAPQRRDDHRKSTFQLQHRKFSSHRVHISSFKSNLRSTSMLHLSHNKEVRFALNALSQQHFNSSKGCTVSLRCATTKQLDSATSSALLFTAKAKDYLSAREACFKSMEEYCVLHSMPKNTP